MLGFESTMVDGDEAWTEVTVAWTGQGEAGPERLGPAILAVRLERSDRWRIASFARREEPLSGDPEIAAVTETVFAAYAAGRGAFGWAAGLPTKVNEYRDETLLTAASDVEVQGDFAVASVTTHSLSNGALGHPRDGGRVILARSGGEWQFIEGQQHEAWDLFDEN